MSTLHHYRYCGIDLDTDFPIPELPEIPDPGVSTDTLTCRQVASIPHQQALNHVSPVLAVGDESVIWQLAGVARYRVSRTEPLIEIEASPEADWDSIRLFLLHPVFVISRLLQGDFMLRAASVVIDNQAIALVGPTACGKSTLAAALHHRGHTLLSDGLLRIAKDKNGIPVAYPQAPWVYLWPDSIKTLEIPSDSLQTVRPGLALFRLETPACEQAVPIKRILMMREQKGNDQDLFESEDSKGFSGIQLFRNFTAGEGWLHPLDLIPRHFQWSVDIAQACQRERLDLPWGWGRFEDCVKKVEDWCSAIKCE